MLSSFYMCIVFPLIIYASHLPYFFTSPSCSLFLFFFLFKSTNLFASVCFHTKMIFTSLISLELSLLLSLSFPFYVVISQLHFKWVFFICALLFIARHLLIHCVMLVLHRRTMFTIVTNLSLWMLFSFSLLWPFSSDYTFSCNLSKGKQVANKNRRWPIMKMKWGNRSELQCSIQLLIFSNAFKHFTIVTMQLQ